MNKKLNKHKLQIIRPNEAVGLIGWLYALLNYRYFMPILFTWWMFIYPINFIFCNTNYIYGITDRVRMSIDFNCNKFLNKYRNIFSPISIHALNFIVYPSFISENIGRNSRSKNRINFNDSIHTTPITTTYFQFVSIKKYIRIPICIGCKNRRKMDFFRLSSFIYFPCTHIFPNLIENFNSISFEEPQIIDCEILPNTSIGNIWYIILPISEKTRISENEVLTTEYLTTNPNKFP